MVFNGTKRTFYCKVSNAFNTILEYEGQFCLKPTDNACFKKCKEYIYKKKFSNEYKEFILDSYRCENILTLARLQPFCNTYGLDIGV